MVLQLSALNAMCLPYDSVDLTHFLNVRKTKTDFWREALHIYIKSWLSFLELIWEAQSMLH